MVMPRAFSSGALSIESNDRYLFFGLCLDRTLVITAVSVVLPWSMCPIVPTFTCGFALSNFSFAISQLLRVLNRFLDFSTLCSGNDFVGNRLRDFFVVCKMHRIGRAALGSRAHVR